MRKRVILALMLVFALVAASSCSLIIKDEEVDKQTPIIEVAGRTFTKAEVNEQVEAVMDYEEYMYSMYGISYDRTDASTISMAQDSAIDAMVQQAVLEKKAADLGLDALSEEEAAIVRRRDMERLQAMVGYCRTAKCLRGYILDYFGQPHADACGSCGNCRAKYRAEDITTHAQMILSCAVRIRDALGYGVGKTLLIQVLRGSRDQRVLQLRLDKLPTYGLLAELPESAVRARVEYLEMEGYLKTDPDHGALLLTPQAREVLFRGKTLTMPVRIEQEERAKAGALPPADADLFQALRATRAQIARRRGVPAYVVFSDATLTDMARRAPRTMADFLEVSGVGQTKARQYGEAFLETIAAHAGEK